MSRRGSPVCPHRVEISLPSNAPAKAADVILLAKLGRRVGDAKYIVSREVAAEVASEKKRERQSLEKRLSVASRIGSAVFGLGWFLSLVSKIVARGGGEADEKG